MTRLILKIGIAAVLTVAFQGVNAAGPPYDQLEVDRALPTFQERTAAPKFESGSPYDQVELDRTLPQFPERITGIELGAPHDPLALERSLPNVAERVGADTEASAGASAWDKDYHFMAPAQ